MHIAENSSSLPVHLILHWIIGCNIYLVEFTLWFLHDYAAFRYRDGEL